MFNLSKREINVLTGGGVFLIVFTAAQFVYSPAIEKRDTLERVLSQKQISLEEMDLLQQKFQAVSNQFDTETSTISNRGESFSLFSFLDSQAQQSGVKGNVDYMKPGTKEIENSMYAIASVKLKLQDLYLKELVDFLYRIESFKNGVRITSLSLTKAGKEKTKIDAMIETQTLMLKEGR
jgi:general secretion pathway protein M